MNVLFETQLTHMFWSIEKLIIAAEDLSPAEREIGHAIGPAPGSYRSMVTHLIHVLFFFTDIFDGVEPVERHALKAECETLSGMHATFEIAQKQLRRAISSWIRHNPLTNELNFEWEGRRMTGLVMLTYMFQHSAHHAAECLHIRNCLGRRGPPLWALYWASEAQSQSELKY